MKRNMATIMVLMLAVLTLFGCSSSKSTSDDGVHIGILQYVEHQSLTAARKGFVDELEKEGILTGIILSLIMKMHKVTSQIYKPFQPI